MKPFKSLLERSQLFSGFNHLENFFLPTPLTSFISVSGATTLPGENLRATCRKKNQCFKELVQTYTNGVTYTTLCVNL